jgi:hypothetical protein
LLPCDPALTLSKPKFANRFDIAFVSSGLVHRVKEMAPVMRAGSRVLIESAKYA